ncbi:hypothetical protein ACVJGD_007835 [Bradyrhizobium sp. USDA 10063]
MGIDNIDVTILAGPSTNTRISQNRTLERGLPSTASRAGSTKGPTDISQRIRPVFDLNRFGLNTTVLDREANRSQAEKR